MPNRVIAAVDDMIFAAKIKGSADASSVEVEFVKSSSAAMDAILRETPTMIICDLHSVKCDPMALAHRIKDDQRLHAIPMVGFFSHVNLELKHRAEAAGFDRVLPRSAFVKRLGAVLIGRI